MDNFIKFCIKCGVRGSVVTKKFEKPLKDMKHYLWCRNCNANYIVIEVTNNG